MTSRAAVGVALCVALSSPAIAGDWSASAGWGLRLDDHRLATGAPGEPPARVTPWTQAVLPALELAGEPLGARIVVAASGRLELGSSVPGQGQGRLRSGNAGEASASVARTFAPGFDFTADGSAARSRDLLDVDQATVSADGDATRWSGSARADSRWLEGEWRSRGWRSASSPGDTRSLTWGARAFLDRSPLGAWFVNGHERRLDRDAVSMLEARTAALGVRREVAPDLGVTLELGAVAERIGSERETARPALGVELATPGDDASRATQLRVRFARELGNEFEIELGRRAGRANAWARASSQVDIEGADAAGPAVIQRAALGVGDTLATATVLGLEVSVARNRSYRGLPLEPITAARIGAWVERRVQPWLLCRAGWDLLRRSESGPEVAPGFRRSRFEIQLQASSRRHP